jgi:hypothetical protein
MPGSSLYAKGAALAFACTTGPACAAIPKVASNAIKTVFFI